MVASRLYNVLLVKRKLSRNGPHFMKIFHFYDLACACLCVVCTFVFVCTLVCQCAAIELDLRVVGGWSQLEIDSLK